MKPHQAAQRLQLGCVEGIRHQVLDYQLGSNVLHRDDTASGKITPMLVPHVDALGLDRGCFAFDLDAITATPSFRRWLPGGSRASI